MPTHDKINMGKGEKEEVVGLLLCPLETQCFLRFIKKVFQYRNISNKLNVRILE